MATDEQLLSACGLSHIDNWDTFVTKVKLRGGKTPNDFYQHFSAGWASLSRGQHSKNLKILLIGRTLGSADITVVWQADNSDATKAFVDVILVSTDVSIHESETAHIFRTWGWTQ